VIYIRRNSTASQRGHKATAETDARTVGLMYFSACQPATITSSRNYSPSQEFKIIHSWGRTQSSPQICQRPYFLDEAAAELAKQTSLLTLPYGCGRSYGDVCLNAGGRLLMTGRLNRFIHTDWNRGVVQAEAGVTLADLVSVTVPHRWFPYVVPGTKSVTLGGLVANDVHGKNHELEGTFGCHVTRLGLARSDGRTLTVSRNENSELFAATVGGLGLTGLITWVEMKLQPIESAFIDAEAVRMVKLDDFFRFAEQRTSWPYQIAWVDCLAKGRKLGRGIYIRGRHSLSGGLKVHDNARLGVPVDPPFSVLNRSSVSLFNALYRNRPWLFGKLQHVPYDAFFCPLDRVNYWPRLYGRRGFFQHQSVTPLAHAYDVTRSLLELTAEHGQGSFLVVLKLFGERRSPGILSFPMPGVTLALDFPNQGERTKRLLDRMSEVVLAAGGRLYPAKDATMSAEAFRTGFPEWRKVENLRDPKIMSDFWRRVTA
jgi:FAD/FMN-containing dehydrogenase